jgi:hypothetical protein
LFSTKQTSSLNVTWSHHDIAEWLLIKHWTTITHSLNQLTYVSFDHNFYPCFNASCFYFRPQKDLYYDAERETADKEKEEAKKKQQARQCKFYRVIFLVRQCKFYRFIFLVWSTVKPV